MSDQQVALKYFQRRLTNLSAANRLVFMPRLRTGQEVDLAKSEWALLKPFKQVREAILNQKKVLLAAQADPRDPEQNELGRQLARLLRQDQFIRQEQGTEDLYVGYPFVSGLLSKDQPCKAPLILWPVSLVLEQGKYILQPRSDQAPILNQAFLLAWAHYSNVKLDEALFEADLTTLLDNSPQPSELNQHPDHAYFMTGLYRLLQSYKIEFRLDATAIADEPQALIEGRKDDYIGQLGSGVINLVPWMVLGLFKQPDGHLSGDYDQLTADNKSLEDVFTSPASLNGEAPLREADAYLPLPYDESQWQAFTQIRKGYSVVIQGPPGSGKSQIISNLLADYACRGLKVALVCQKRVALDVVYDRLKNLGIANWVALIHDHQHDRRALYDQLKAQVDLIEDYQKELGSLDSYKLEQDYNTLSRQLEGVLKPLDEFKQALYSATEYGLSAKQLYVLTHQLPAIQDEAMADLSATIWERIDSLPVYSELKISQVRLQQLFFQFKQLTDVSTLELLKAYKSLAEMPDWSALKLVDWQRAHELQDQVATELDLLSSQFGIHDDEHLDMALQPADQWLKDHEAIQANQALVGSISRYIDYPAELQRALLIFERLTTNGQRLNQIWKFIISADLDKLRQQIADYRSGQNSLFKLFNSSYKQAVKELGYSFNVSDKQLPVLVDQLEGAVNVYDQLRADIDYLLNNHLQDANLNSFDQIGQLYQLLTDTQSAIERLNVNHLLHVRQEAGQVIRLLEIQRHIVDLAQIGRQLLGSSVTYTYNADGLHPLLNLQYLIKEQAFIQLQKCWAAMATDPLWIRQLVVICLQEGLLFNLQGDTLFNLLHLTWAQLVSQKISNEQTALNLPADQMIDVYEGQLQNLLEQKRELASRIIKVRLQERTALGLEYNRLRNRTTYRDLYDQTSKRSRLWPVRKLMATHRDEAMRICPIWLAGPESMSAMFELEQVFDLVIFDEASQCYAERGIPIAARAKQLVVVGDSQQLPPYNLYQVRYDIDDEVADANPDLDSQSMLDLAERYLPTTMMTGHYRSQHQSLIAFSNYHYYNSKLAYWPSVSEAMQAQTVIKINHIASGIWAKQSNQAEAEAVVNYLISNFQQGLFFGRRVGVITFNVVQQGLIQDLLDEASITRGFTLPADWFVKSLEHVQGDEADVIVFSVAYAKDSAGRVRAQYGSLSQAGGENRLNVGITRARQELVVFTSLYPHELPTDDSTHAGPKLLKQWLHYVWQLSENQGNSQIKELVAKPLSPDSLASRVAATKAVNSALPVVDLVGTSEVILTDDDRFNLQQDARAEFGLLPMRLKARGWKVIRYFDGPR